MSCPGCSNLSEDNPRLAWNLISGLKALKENSIQIFFACNLVIGWSKRIGNILPKWLLNKEIWNPRIKSNHGLALIGLRTTGPRYLVSLWTRFCLFVLQIIFKDIQFLERQTATLEVENIGQVGVFVFYFYQIFLQLCPPVHTALFACLSIKMLFLQHTTLVGPFPM